MSADRPEDEAAAARGAAPAYAPGARVPVAAPAHRAPRPSPEARASVGFVALLAALGAVNAFATDIVIPVLGDIAADLDLATANQRQWVVYAVFLGMAVSQLLIGPISDRHGRRKAGSLGLSGRWLPWGG
ncbi:MAG: MFS transporter, partial [Paracoccaceae bacterium]